MLLFAGFQVPANAVDLIADVVQFKGNTARTKWEFQYAFADTSVKHVANPNGFIGELYCLLTLTSANGDTTVEEWIAESHRQISNGAPMYFLSGIRTLLLKPGSYNVSFTAFDLNDTNNRIATKFVTLVRDFGLQSSMSDVMFTQPARIAADSGFIRNSQPASPNPRHEAIGTDPTFGIYTEVYNALLNKLDTFVVELQVLDNVRREMLTTYIKQVGVNDNLIIREDISAAVLPSNVYYLRVSVKSKDLQTTYAADEDRFYVLNPELPPEGQIFLTEEERFLSSEWAILKGDRLKLELELSSVLASQAEKATLAGCTDERAQQRYLYRFWLIRDPDPMTHANERLDEFRQMYQRAQKFYTSAMQKDGWKTDRGRVLLKYGKPTQIEQFIQTIDTKPYEIWFFQNIQGGTYFYFVDWQLLQNHRLVHTTMIGEIRNENWFNEFAKAFSPNPTPENTLTNPQK